MGLLDHMVMLVSSLSCVQMFCNPMDCSPSGSSIHGISQARILEWVAIFFSRGSSEPRDWACVSYVLYCWATREAPGSMVVLSLISLESWLFSIVGVLVYIPTNYAQGFPFFRMLTDIHYFLSFLIIVILIFMKWYLTLILTCISLMIGDVEHLFMYLLAICTSSLEKYLFISFAH